MKYYILLVRSVPWIRNRKSLCWLGRSQQGGVGLVFTAPGMGPQCDSTDILQIPAFSLGFYSSFPLESLNCYLAASQESYLCLQIYLF